VDILGLSGKAQVGKDYIFEHYLAVHYHRVALADHFKIATIGRGEATREEVFVTKPPHVRAALQRMGTEEGRNLYGEDIWCRTTFAWLEHWAATWKIEAFCIVDCRFRNEVEFIQRHGGKVVRIVAPTRAADSSLDDRARAHQSETELDDFDGFDFYVVNEPGAFISDLQHQLDYGYVYPPGFDAAQVAELRRREAEVAAQARARLAGAAA
jgi:hypothetical protein